jgi:hypothetical protein
MWQGCRHYRFLLVLLIAAVLLGTPGTVEGEEQAAQLTLTAAALPLTYS